MNGKQIFERIQYLEQRNRQLFSELEQKNTENLILQDHNKQLIYTTNRSEAKKNNALRQLNQIQLENQLLQSHNQLLSLQLNHKKSVSVSVQIKKSQLLAM
ncbi:hypothetical protein [Enterococcus rivorum]|uniref:Uncharacterized protein n=1 Tax=Enterococcus rivorum TaxID=762845 RepID=A0A1E5L0C6_9ENTE|nr:hypothetical protein [Enterococcus rivorum]MBP2098798.1 ribonucleotide monophosphatase NagD (HAD superfamily) [Enterococcus rivorum]OEH83533.1 hypothetical protein BCR26_08615 [Enterococcus rivorum]